MLLHVCVRVCGHIHILETKQEMRHRFCLRQINWENKRYDSSLLGVCVFVCLLLWVCVSGRKRAAESSASTLKRNFWIILKLTVKSFLNFIFPLGCLYNNDKVLVFQDFTMCTAIFLYFLKSPVRQDVNKFKKMCIESSMCCHVFVFFL